MMLMRPPRCWSPTNCEEANPSSRMVKKSASGILASRRGSPCRTEYGSMMLQRWLGTVLRYGEQQFKRVKGFAEIT
jgi:hypothetical protein